MRLGIALLAIFAAGLVVQADRGDRRTPQPRSTIDVPLRPVSLEAGPRPGPGAGRRRTGGRSAHGRRIMVSRLGDGRERRRVLVFGCIHGTECAGMAVARLVRRVRSPAGAGLAVVENLNPDGYAQSTRLNGHGVDLNRNFSAGWRPIGRAGELEHSGPRPFSEPETRVARGLVESYRPRVTIWFHQQAQSLVRAWGASVPAARRYARLAGLPFRPMPWMAGTAPNWQNHRFRRTSSFVVELPSGRLSARDAARHAAAIERLVGSRG